TLKFDPVFERTLASRVPPSGRRNTGVAVFFAVSRNVQQILIAKGDLRLQVLAIFLQHSLTQDIGIKLAGLCKLDNLFSDSFPQNGLVAKLKSCASHFECDGHDPLGLGIEFGTVQKLRDGHDPPRYRQWHLLCKSRV